MHSDFDEGVEVPPVSRDDAVFHWALGFLWGLAFGCLVTAFVQVLS